MTDRNDDERAVAEALLRDANSLYQTARLPMAQQVLWQAKVRAARQRRDRIARLVTYAICGALAIPAIVLSGVAWNDATAVTPARPMTVGMLGVIVLMALAIFAAVPLSHRAVRSR